MARKGSSSKAAADAVRAFTEYGSVRGLYAVLEAERTPENEREVKRLIELIQSFAYAYNTGSVYYLQETVRRIGALSVEELPLSEDLRTQLKKLCAEIVSALTVAGETAYPETCFLLQAAELYLKQERLGLAASMAQESVMTYLIERVLRKYLSEIAVLDPEEDLFAFLHTPSYREAIRSWFEAGFVRELPQQWSRFERIYVKIGQAVAPEGGPVFGKKKITSAEDLGNWILEACAMIREDMNGTLSGFYRVKSALNKVRSSYLNDQSFASYWTCRDGSWPIGDLEENVFREEMSRYRSLSGRSTFFRPFLPAYRREEVQELHRELAALKRLGHENVNAVFLTENPAICAAARLAVFAGGQDHNDIERQLDFLNSGKGTAYEAVRDFLVGYERETAWYELWKVLNAKVERDAEDGRKARFAAETAKAKNGAGKKAKPKKK